MKSFHHQYRHHTEAEKLFTVFVQENCYDEKGMLQCMLMWHISPYLKQLEMPAPFLCPKGITPTQLGWLDGWTDR